MGALSGFRLIQLSDRPPQETATFLLADMGMDVIRVDQPTVHAHVARGASDGRETERDAAYNISGRNKRSMILDLRSQPGKEAFYRLARSGDAVLEGYRPGVAKRLGVDYETLRGINPRLVYCSLTGYGQTGPYSHLPAYETEITAAGGLTAQNVDIEGRPTAPGFLVGDGGGGLHAAFGILAALLFRERSGRGQYLDVGMQAALTTFQLGVASGFLRTGKFSRPTPLDLGAFRCKDGKYLSAGPTARDLWEILVDTIGLPELRAASMQDPSWPSVVQKIQERLLTRTRDEWFALLKEAGTAVAPALEMEELLRDPQMLHRGMVRELQHPTLGKVTQVGFPIQFSETPAEFRRFAPQRGQDTEEVLAELGYSAAERAQFVASSQAGAHGG